MEWNVNNRQLNKCLEIMGYVPMGTFCYICGDNINKENLCLECFELIENSKKKRSRQMFEGQPYIECGYHWLSETGRHYPANFFSYNYVTQDPESMIKIAYLSIIIDVQDANCVNCSRKIDKDIYCYADIYACKNCASRAISYFDLMPITYMLLKEIFENIKDIARHAVLYHHKIKLLNCTSEW